VNFWRLVSMPFRSRRTYLAYVDYMPHGIIVGEDPSGAQYKTHSPRWWQIHEWWRWWRLPKAKRHSMIVGGGFLKHYKTVKLVRLRDPWVRYQDGAKSVEKRQPFHT
jgi:hypothetical protein